MKFCIMRNPFLSIVTLLIFFQTYSETNAQLPIPEGRRLRDIVAENYPEGKLLIGATTGAWGLTEFIGDVMDREFSYVTPENDFKHSVIRANHDSWNWSRADAWLQHIKDNNQTLRIHGPIAPQCSNWAKEDNRTAEELSEELDTFMTALCQRYNGVEGIKYLDVVNEIALDDGSWFGPRIGTDQWENPWLKIGQDDDPNKTPLYIKQAFAIANEYAPDLKQIINNHCHPGTAGMEKVKETALYLRDRGYRIDGIGWQAHVEVGWATQGNLQHLRDLIDWCQERNLEFHITEFDAWILNPTTQTLEGQAYTYKAIMDVLLEKLDTITIGWNTWHITDASGWQIERIPSLFDENYKPKPAYYAFQLALETKGDYTTQHNVTFKVKNSETGEFLDNYEVYFADSIKQPSEGNATNFENILPARYTVQIKKPLFNTFVKKHINIYSDTTITLSLNPAIYDATFLLQNEHTGNGISTVSVTVDTINSNSGLDGNATFNLRPGEYHASFERNGFESFEADYTILSDTIIKIMLRQTLGDIKFRVRNQDQPINNVQVILNEDTVYTNSLGIVLFDTQSVDSNYSFYLSKEKYKSQEGIFILKADTTINIQLQKSVANIQFQIHPEIVTPENSYVILDNDTAYFNSEGISKLYDIPIEQEYQYKVFNTNYPDLVDTVYLTNDTIINVTLSVTSVGINDALSLTIFPNPTKDMLFIESNSNIEKIAIYSVAGRKIIEFNVYAKKTVKNISELANGVYFLGVVHENGKKQLVRFIKMNQ